MKIPCLPRMFWRETSNRQKKRVEAGVQTEGGGMKDEGWISDCSSYFIPHPSSFILSLWRDRARISLGLPFLEPLLEKAAPQTLILKRTCSKPKIITRRRTKPIEFGAWPKNRKIKLSFSSKKCIIVRYSFSRISGDTLVKGSFWIGLRAGSVSQLEVALEFLSSRIPKLRSRKSFSEGHPVRKLL